MKKKYVLPIALAGILAFSSCEQTSKTDNVPEKKENLAIDKKDMNQVAKPGDNFFEYANGGWIKSNPVPSDKTQYGSFTVLYDNNQIKLKELITEVSKAKNEPNTNAQKIADCFNSGMDTLAIEKAGYQPIAKDLAKIDEIKNTKDLIVAIANMHKESDYPLFYFSDVQDDKNSSNVIGILYQGGIGLPDRDYYLADNEQIASIRTAYTNLIQKMFVLTDVKIEDAKLYSQKVLDIETKLAENSFTRLELRDPFNNYNKMDLEGLKKLSPDFDWTLYFETLGLTKTDEINVAQTKFIKNLSVLVKDVTIEDWKVYLKWNLINGAANYLSKDFVKTNFDFYGTVLSGQKEMVSRWKKVLQTTNGVLGEALGELYVKKYFPASAKERMVKLVENLKNAFSQRIETTDWMQDVTKAKAQEKLKAITVKVGYPDKWIDYSKLTITKDSYYKNVKAASIFVFNRSLDRIGKPYDKSRWGMTPQTINAYYSPNSNEIVFPAAILQPPFFYMDADDAVNYGGIGVVIGHEMTHGFDDQGRNYDKDGNLNNWWTEKDSKAFETKKQVLVDIFSKYVELDSLHVNGELTIGENIADLGGLNISWDAFQTTEQSKSTEKINDFTPSQRFILAYAKLWRQTILPEELTRRLKEDVHSPGDARVNVSLFNFHATYENFDIKDTDKLFIPKAEQASIW